MLRAIGAQIEKTTSREACRDLSGRRMRDINNEKKYVMQQRFCCYFSTVCFTCPPGIFFLVRVKIVFSYSQAVSTLYCSYTFNLQNSDRESAYLGKEWQVVPES